MKSLCWRRLLAGAVARGEKPMLEQEDVWPCRGPTLEQSVPEELHPVEGTHAGAVCEELQPVGKTHAGEVCEGLSAMGGTPCRSRDRV